MSKIKADEIVGRGFPTDEGQRLAETLLDNREFDWSKDHVDLTGCDPALLISAFFIAFLQAVHDRNSGLLIAARRLQWEFEFEFQHDNVRTWMNGFEPRLLLEHQGNHA